MSENIDSTINSNENLQAPRLSFFESIKLFQETPNFLEFLLLQSEKLTQKYGDIIRLSKKEFIISSPPAFKAILKDKSNHFTKRNRAYARIKHILGDGLIASDDTVWNKHHEPLHAYFHKGRLEYFANVMVACTKTFIQEWQKKQKQHCDIVKEMTYLTASIAFNSFCSYQPSHQELHQIHHSIAKGTPHISHAIFLSPWWMSPANLQFFWSMKKIKNILVGIIQRREQQYSCNPDKFHPNNFNPKDKEDYLDLLLSLRETKTSDSFSAEKNKAYAFSTQEVIDELQTIVFTGHETSACALAWVWHLLALHPEYQLLLEEELQNVLGNRTPTLEDCSSLIFTKACFLEALRLYPPIWCLPRTAEKEDIIEGYKIPLKSRLILNVYALHRNPHYWEKPNEFYPPRFLKDPGILQRQSFAFLPFSIGKHACIGSQFALIEGILLIALLTQHFRFKPQYKLDQVKPTPYLSLRPPPLRMTLTHKEI